MLRKSPVTHALRLKRGKLPRTHLRRAIVPLLVDNIPKSGDDGQLQVCAIDELTHFHHKKTNKSKCPPNASYRKAIDNNVRCAEWLDLRCVSVCRPPVVCQLSGQRLGLYAGQRSDAKYYVDIRAAGFIWKPTPNCAHDSVESARNARACACACEYVNSCI